MRDEYRKPTQWRHLETPRRWESAWEIIPYMIAPESILGDRASGSPQIIHMARRKNPNSKNPYNALLEWRWPLEPTGISAEVIWVAPTARSVDHELTEKSLWAGTNFDFRGSSGKRYVVLATRYTQYLVKEPNIQTPFSEALMTPDIIEAWKGYFDTLHLQWDQDFQSASWSSPELRTFLLPLVKGLSSVENMNAAHPRATTYEARSLFSREMNKFYALLAVNWAYAFRRGSNAGAKWLLQITLWAWEGFKNRAWKKYSWLRDEFLHSLFHKKTPFADIVGDHRKSTLVALAHLTRQVRDYSQKWHIRK
jgi:hypothetical protein